VPRTPINLSWRMRTKRGLRAESPRRINRVVSPSCPQKRAFSVQEHVGLRIISLREHGFGLDAFSSLLTAEGLRCHLRAHSLGAFVQQGTAKWLRLTPPNRIHSVHFACSIEPRFNSTYISLQVMDRLTAWPPSPPPPCARLTNKTGRTRLSLLGTRYFPSPWTQSYILSVPQSSLNTSLASVG
jgi:hypothetical protein